MRIKIGLALGAALAAALLPVGSIGAQNATDAWIDVVHGIGGGANPVDVYVGGGTAPTEWDLAIADLQYGQHVEIGEIAAGDYNVLVCQAVPAPADTISSCPQGAVNGNFGNPIELVANERYLVVAAYGGPDTEAPGRPIVRPPGYERVDSEGGSQNQVHTEIVLADVRVLALDDKVQAQATGDAPERVQAAVAVLELSQADSAIVASAQQRGEISLALRGVEAETANMRVPSAAPHATGERGGGGGIVVHAYGRTGGRS